LKRRSALTTENPASGKPISVNAAFAVHPAFRRGLAVGRADGGLIATSPRDHLFYIRYAQFLDEKNNFRRGNIQAMVIGLKITALAASVALAGDCLISELPGLNPFINLAHPLDNFFMSCHCATTSCFSFYLVSVRGCVTRLDLYPGTFAPSNSKYPG
jgi:hypothetical protein